MIIILIKIIFMRIMLDILQIECIKRYNKKQYYGLRTFNKRN